MSHISAYAAHQGGLVLWYGLGRPVIAPKIGYWFIFVLLGWRFVFGIIMKWDGREPHIVRCHHGSGGINEAVPLLRLKLGRKWATPRTSSIGRPARGYSVSPPCQLKPPCILYTIKNYMPVSRSLQSWVSTTQSVERTANAIETRYRRKLLQRRLCAYSTYNSFLYLVSRGYFGECLFAYGRRWSLCCTWPDGKRSNNVIKAPCIGVRHWNHLTSQPGSPCFFVWPTM